MKAFALFIIFLAFSTVYCKDGFLNLKCKLSKHRQRISPHCRRYLGIEPTPPISTHLPTTNTTKNTLTTLVEVFHEVEEEMGGSPHWVLYLILAFIVGYGGSVLFLNCKLNMSIGRSLRFGSVVLLCPRSIQTQCKWPSHPPSSARPTRSRR